MRVYDVTELPRLLNKAEFAVTITEESKNRRAMYRAEEKRNQLMVDGNEDTIAFLKKCNLQIQIFVPRTDSEILRCYELIVRTNQLNMSGKKYSQKEFDDVLNRVGYRNFAFSCKDDFGEYGIVGFGQYRVEQKTLIFTEFAMSCRVAGKYVESALFTSLLEREHCIEGVFEVQKTKKNILLRKSLDDIGFVEKSNEGNIVSYVFSVPLKHDDLVLCR